MTHFSGSFIHLQILISICQIIDPSSNPQIYPSIYLSIHSSTHQPIQPCIQPSTDLPIISSANPSIHHSTNSLNNLSIQSPSINPLRPQHQSINFSSIHSAFRPFLSHSFIHLCATHQSIPQILLAYSHLSSVYLLIHPAYNCPPIHLFINQPIHYSDIHPCTHLSVQPGILSSLRVTVFVHHSDFLLCHFSYFHHLSSPLWQCGFTCACLPVLFSSDTNNSNNKTK